MSNFDKFIETLVSNDIYFFCFHGFATVTSCTELGAAILHDKRIILLIEKDFPVPENLKKVCEIIREVEGVEIKENTQPIIFEIAQKLLKIDKLEIRQNFEKFEERNS